MKTQSNMFKQLITKIVGFYGKRPVALLSIASMLSFLLTMAALLHHTYLPDEDAYEMLAKSLAQHGSYSLPVEAFFEPANTPNSYYAPGWPFVLSLGYRALHSETGFFLIAGALWAILPFLVHYLGSEMGLSSGGRLWLLAWLVTNPLLLFYHLHLMTEVLAIPLLTLILIFGLRLLRTASWQSAIMLGIVSGLSHLTRTALVIPVISVWCACLLFRNRRLFTLRLFAVYALVHIVVVLPWLIRMDKVGGGATIGTERKLGDNLYTYNYRGVSNPYHLRAGESIQFPDGLEQLTAAQRDKLLLTLALQSIRRDPVRYLLNCSRRMYYLLSPVPNFYNANIVTTLGMAFVSVVYLLVPLIAIILAAGYLRSRLTAAQRMLLLSLGFWYAFHILMHASVRQRLPSDLIVAVLFGSIAFGPRFTTLFAGRENEAIVESHVY